MSLKIPGEREDGKKKKAAVDKRMKDTDAYVYNKLDEDGGTKMTYTITRYSDDDGTVVKGQGHKREDSDITRGTAEGLGKSS